MGISDTESQSQALVSVSEETTHTQQNPLEIAQQKLLELSRSESISVSDRLIIKEAAEEFQVYLTELKKRYEFLKNQGFNPDSNPLLLYQLCDDTRNDIFLLGGITIDRRIPKSIVVKPGETKIGATLDSQIKISPEGLARELEVLGYLNQGEDLTDRVRRISGEPSVHYERFNSTNGENIRLPSTGNDNRALPSANRRERRMVYLASPLLGTGIIAGVKIESTPKLENCQFALDDSIRSAMVAIYGVSSKKSVVQALLRCAK